MRYVFMIVMMSVLGTIQAQFKITDYHVFSNNGHSVVFFNESGEHVFFTTYKNHELVVEDLWTGDRERKNAIVGQIVNKKPTVFEEKTLQVLEVSQRVSKNYKTENNNISVRFLKNDTYEIVDASKTVTAQGHYYMSNESILNLTNVDGDYIGAVINKEGLLLIIGETVLHLIVKNE